MRTRIQDLLAAALLLPALNIPFASVRAQGTAFTYQGRLNSGGGPAGGSYDLTFTLYDSTNLPGSVIAGPLTNSATGVTNGLFTAALDFGPGVFTGNARWLEIAVRTNGGGGFATLAPRQQITPTPYAVMAGSASNLLGTLPAAQLSGMIPSSDISGTYTGPVTFNNGADSFDGTFVGQFFGSSFFGGSFNGNFFGDGNGLFNLNASQLMGTIPDSHLAANVAFLNSNQVFTAQNVFAQGIGIGNPAPVFSVDAMSSQAVGRFISTNAYFGSVLVLQNQTTNLSSEFYGAINFNNSLGGTPGQIAYIVPNPTNQNYDYLRFDVGGGEALVLQADPRGAGVGSLIGGTGWNYIDVGSGGDVIAGGGFPNIGNIIYSNSSGVFIGAGSANHVGPNVNDSVIVGGFGNTASSWDATIGGGVNNFIQTNAQYATISGGVLNYIDGGAFESAIAGGNRNTNGPGAYRSFIGGGIYNSILAGAYQTVIGGGYQNIVQADAVDSVIGGGFVNTIQSNNWISVVGGGQNNTMGTNATASVISGGYDNTIGFSVNPPYYVFGATIAGGFLNRVGDLSAQATISGGNFNTIQTNAPGTVIAGGTLNGIQANASGAVIGGGYGNTNGGPNSVIGGGVNNLIQPTASSAAIPGGFKNTAGGSYSFAAGSYAQATNDGAFVWADSSSTNAFGSTISNQFLVRASGGVQFVTAGAGVTVDGQPILAGNNGSGLVGVNAATLAGFLPSAFASATGSPGYIQNQNSGPQTASFNIAGSAVVSGPLTATSLVVSNIVASGPVTAPTVAANGVTGGTVSATTVANANALVITNSFRVSGAGKATPTPAFIVVSASTNLFYSNAVRINNPLCDGKPNAILIATHNVSAQSSFGYSNHPLGVWYDGAYWEILNEDIATMPTNIAFNVLIINP